MKKTCVLIITLLATMGCLSATAQQDAVPTTKSLLWRISGNHLSKPSYLFGTMHLICPEDFFLAAKVNECLADCNKVCFEFDLSDTSLTRQMKAALIDKSGKKLSDYYSTGEYLQVQRFFKDSLKIDLDKLQKIKPVVLQSILIAKVMSCAHPMSYEKDFLRTAQKDGKEIMGLETFNEQMALTDLLSSKVVNATVALAKGKRNMYEMHEGWQKLVDAYKQQDIAQLYHLATQASGLYFNDAFLDERNKKWINNMPGKMEASPVFFAVGAAHLWGENGVINLLRKNGYTVEPIIDTINEFKGPPQGVLTYVDRMPKPGFDLSQYLSANIHYPDEARKKHIEGKVIVKFIVNEDGTISDCALLKSIGGGCDEEALRVVKNMSPWAPGMTKDGKAVKVYFTLPISFKLE